MLVSLLVYVVFFSSVFRVRTITVQGNRVATDGELKALLVKKLDARGHIARWLGSDNVWYWFSARVNGDPSIPAADTVEITTDLFQRAVMIAIKERTFKGVWCADTCVGFDKNGVAYFLAPEVYGSLLLKIDDENKTPVTLGAPVIADDAARTHMFGTLDVLMAKGVALDRVTVKDVSLREWEAESIHGTVFKFTMDFVPTNLGGVLDDLRGKTAFDTLSYVDFRVQNRVYYK